MTFKQRQKIHDAANAPGLTTTVIVLAIVVGSIILCYAGKINGDAFVALTSGIVGGVLVRAGVASGSAATGDPPAQD